MGVMQLINTVKNSYPSARLRFAISEALHISRFMVVVSFATVMVLYFAPRYRPELGWPEITLDVLPGAFVANVTVFYLLFLIEAYIKQRRLLRTGYANWHQR